MFHGPIPSHLPVFVRFPFVMVIAPGLLARRPRRGRCGRRRRRLRRSGKHRVYYFYIIVFSAGYSVFHRITRGKLFLLHTPSLYPSLDFFIFIFRLSALHRTPVHC